MIRGRLTDSNGHCVIKKVYKTTNFLERMLGLLIRKELDADEGLLITPCSSVHTFGMKYTIDLVFLNKELQIVKLVQSLRPWRMASSNSSYIVLELIEDSIRELKLTIGQQLEWHNESAN